PERIAKIIGRLREVRGGALTEGKFFRRHAGEGVYWDMIEQLFSVARRRAGFTEDDTRIPDTFRRPGVEQASLF
ncbi:MAG: radical SAM protein, partial [Nitrospirae bacterium]|nr:radical SAM protein [Nitrospirota bacterium]